ncbi:hypothetical protein D3C76_1694990 [compost metagenome]
MKSNLDLVIIDISFVVLSLFLAFIGINLDGTFIAWCCFLVSGACMVAAILDYLDYRQWKKRSKIKML